MTPELQKAFDFASDATKQLITVATGVITVTVLFSKDLDARSRHWALAAWIVLTLSVLGGLAVLGNLSGHLQNASTKCETPTINGTGIRFFSRCQFFLFWLGVCLVMVFGIFAMDVNPEAGHNANHPVTVNCVAPPATLQQPAQPPRP
jgi:uncharacterized membrane protein